MLNTSHKRNWLIKGGLGTVLLGFGICAIVEIGILKYNGMETLQWVTLGTLSLVVFMVGLFLLFGSFQEKISYLKKQGKL
ncbi:hypothetical protein GCM10009117_02980 [Gangjinia marincola]|uniref:Uncharacterized protein n=1 Tax=Gangjinia marincola TaxID=578463 RepID=A0ABP3XPA7_9FLAO